MEEFYNCFYLALIWGSQAHVNDELASIHEQVVFDNGEELIREAEEEEKTKTEVVNSTQREPAKVPNVVPRPQNIAPMPQITIPQMDRSQYWNPYNNSTDHYPNVELMPSMIDTPIMREQESLYNTLERRRKRQHPLREQYQHCETQKKRHYQHHQNEQHHHHDQHHHQEQHKEPKLEQNEEPHNQHQQDQQLKHQAQSEHHQEQHEEQQQDQHKEPTLEQHEEPKSEQHEEPHHRIHQAQSKVLEPSPPSSHQNLTHKEVDTWSPSHPNVQSHPQHQEQLKSDSHTQERHEHISENIADSREKEPIQIQNDIPVTNPPPLLLQPQESSTKNVIFNPMPNLFPEIKVGHLVKDVTFDVVVHKDCAK